MGIREFFSRNVALAAPATITANHSSVVITIRKEWLAERSTIDETAARLLNALIGEGGGDWGGADYPEIGLCPNSAAAIITAIDATANRVQVES